MGWHDHRGHVSTHMENLEAAAKNIIYEDFQSGLKTTFNILYSIDPINGVIHSRRIYNDKSYQDNFVRADDLLDHYNYNKRMRFGCALFFNGICVNEGYLTKEQCSEYSKSIKEENVLLRTPKLPYA